MQLYLFNGFFRRVHVKRWSLQPTMRQGLASWLLLPVNYLSGGKPDPHVPAERVNASVALIEKTGAATTKIIYKTWTIPSKEMKLAT